MGSAQETFRIAVVGGGIGGLFTALAIHHACGGQGIAIDVYEQAEQYKEIGAGVGIGINAVKLIHAIGLGDEMSQLAGRRNGAWISFRRYYDGEDIVTIPSLETKKIRQGSVHRAEFLDLLVKTVKERNAASLHTNKHCKGFSVSRFASHI